MKDIGTFVAATVAIGFLYEFFLKEQHNQETLHQLQSILVGPSMHDLLDRHDTAAHGQLEETVRTWMDNSVPMAAKWGLTGFVQPLDFPRLFSDLRDNDELLWFNTYCPDQGRCYEPLIDAVKNGAHIKMLVIDPECENTILRAHEIESFGYHPDRFQPEARNTLRLLGRCEEVLQSVPIRGSFEVRRYVDLPCIPMYIRLRNGVRDVGFTSFFLTEPAFSSVHLKWRETPNGMLELFHKYFWKKWNTNVDKRLALVQSESLH